MIIILLILTAAGFFMLFRNFGISPAKFTTVNSEEELVEALIDGFDTGYEPVSVRTSGFRLDESRIASYISSEISNDAEDLCIMPERYTASGMDIFGLWQFRIFFSGSDSADRWSVYGAEKDENGEESTFPDREEVFQAQSLVSEALDRISAEIAGSVSAEGGGETELHRAIFLYLCEHVEYDYELSEAIINGDYGSPLRKNRGSYGALIEGKTVCSGYASAYKAICDRLGLDCWVASNTDHAWNLVLIDGEIFCVDTTSGDQGTWVADQFFLIDPASYESLYGYRPGEDCYIPERFRA